MTKARSLSDFIESDGSVTLVDNQKIKVGTGNDLEIYHDGSNSFIKDVGTGELRLSGSSYVKLLDANNEKGLEFRTNEGVKLFYNNVEKIETTSTGISVTGNATFPDNGKAIFGAGSDLQIYHDGSNSFINNDTGILQLTNNDIRFKTSGDETMLRAVANGAVELMHNSATKLETTASGAHTSGTQLTLKTTSSTANDRSGAGFTATESSTDSSRNARMFLDADNGGFSTGNSGTYFFVEKKAGGGEVNFINQGNANMNFTINGSHTKLKVISAGVDVTGTLQINSTSTADTIKLIRGTTSQNSMIKFVTGSSDKWIVGQRNDSTDHFRLYS